MEPVLYQIDQHFFCPDSGLLYRVVEGHREDVGHLPPQPSQLLRLLIQHHPQMVSHAQIQEALWPGLSTEYEKGMHFCVRQIRAAFGDRAKDPQFVETIARRGYRLIPRAKEVPSQVGSHAAVSEARLEADSTTNADRTASADLSSGLEDSGTDRQHSSLHRGSSSGGLTLRGPAFIGIAFVVPTLLLLVSYLAWLRSERNTEERSLSLAIMSFEDPRSPDSLRNRNNIAEWLVEEFTNSSKNRLQVIGPTSTDGFGVDGKQLSTLVERLKPDYVINGRFLSGEPKHILAEIIRASDGVHVWVKRIQDPLSETDAQVIANGFYRLLEAPLP